MEKEEDLVTSKANLLEIEKNMEDYMRCSRDYFKTLLEDWLLLRKKIQTEARKVVVLHPHFTEKHNEYEKAENTAEQTCTICGVKIWNYGRYVNGQIVYGNFNEILKREMINDKIGILHMKPSSSIKLKVGNRSYLFE